MKIIATAFPTPRQRLVPNHIIIADRAGVPFSNWLLVGGLVTIGLPGKACVFAFEEIMGWVGRVMLGKGVRGVRVFVVSE